MDDETGWSLILTEGWGPLVLDAVVRRIESEMVGNRARLVRAVVDPDAAPAEDVEHVHRVILDAIEAETGADLDALGSQAAWACWEETWDHLATRWAGGGRLLTLPPEHTATVAAAMARLPVRVAAAAGADTRGIPAQPLLIDGVLHIDAEGLFAWIATQHDIEADVRADVDLLLALCRAHGHGNGPASD